MSVAYLNLRTQADSAARTARIEFDIRNDSQQIWPAGGEFAISYHLFDSEAGALIEDGPRVHPNRALKPGESAHTAFDVSFPPEDGRYHAIASPMREGVVWHYEQGWPFLLLEAIVKDGIATIQSARVATLADLRRSRAFRSVGRAFVYPVLTVWRNRGLIRVMVRREILGRYRGSFGGSFWTIFNPLLLIVTYFFIFGVVLKTRFGPDQSRTSFALYFLAGMLPWLAFSEAAGRAPTVMLEYRNFVKKLVFAVETLPVNLVVAGLVSEFFAILLFTGFLFAIRRSIPASLLWLPLLIAPQILFTAGVSWFLAGLGVFVRDLGQIIGYLLNIWFFITPICYPESSLPAGAATVLSKNPIYVLVRGYRAVFLDRHAPEIGPLWKLWVLAAVVFILGHAWFYKLRKSFPDVI